MPLIEQTPRRVCARRDLPMPGSPETSTTWPSLRWPCSQQSSSRSSSGLAADERGQAGSSAWLRSGSPLRPRRAPATSRPGPKKPFNRRSPRSLHSNIPPSRRRVLVAMTTLFGPASAWRRAARLGVSPTTVSSCAAPVPIFSPTTTRPVAIPTRTCKASSCPGGQLSNRRDQTQPRPHSAFCVVLVRLGIAEVGEHAVGQDTWLRSRRSDQWASAQHPW